MSDMQLDKALVLNLIIYQDHSKPGFLEGLVSNLWGVACLPHSLEQFAFNH